MNIKNKSINTIFFLVSFFTISITSFAQNVGIGTTNPTNPLHVESTSNDPLRIEGLQVYVTEGSLLVVDPNTGIVKQMPVDSLASILGSGSGPDSDEQTLSLSSTDLLSISNGNFVKIGYPDYKTVRAGFSGVPSTGSWEIPIPSSYWYGSIFMVIKVMDHTGRLTTYEINGYLNNPNGWAGSNVTKTGNGIYQNVRLSCNTSSWNDFRIYIGDAGQSQSLKKVFITEFYAMGRSNTVKTVTKNLHDIPIQIVTSFANTVQYTY